MTSIDSQEVTTPVASSTQVAWFHCFAGIAGDMALASLVDAGADFEQILDMLGKLEIRGWTIDPIPVLRCGIAATHLRFHASGDGVIRTLPAVRALITEASLPARVKDRSLAAFSALAEAEGRLHRRHPDHVHFHELAGYDTILDIVGTMSALEILGVDAVYASAVATGTGMVRTEHGLLPNPTPAVLELLKDAPLQGRDLTAELTTPTGAALLAALVAGYGPMPPMRVLATGYGAGARELDGLPNCTQVVIGSPSAPAGTVSFGQPLVLVEANLDDATGEQLVDAVASLLSANAADAWVTPVLMKKGRPGHVLSALCDVALVSQIREVLIAETGTFGVRAHLVDRWASTRVVDTVDVAGRWVRVKVSPGRVKVEHDDAVRAAHTLGIPTRDVLARAEQAWRDRTD